MLNSFSNSILTNVILISFTNNSLHREIPKNKWAKALQFNFNLYLWLYHNFRHYRNVDTTHQCFFFDCQQIRLAAHAHFQIIANFDNNFQLYSIIMGDYSIRHIHIHLTELYKSIYIIKSWRTRERGKLFIIINFFLCVCFLFFRRREGFRGIFLALSHLCAECTKENSSSRSSQKPKTYCTRYTVVVVHDCRRVYLKQNGLFEMFFTRSTWVHSHQ